MDSILPGADRMVEQLEFDDEDSKASAAKPSKHSSLKGLTGGDWSLKADD